ncbi:TPA: cysteine/O-acetylserine transporter [Kluyvera georgiana]
MSLSIAGAFLAYTFITALTPGPNNILALSCVHTHGFHKSLRPLAGMGAGFLIIMLLCALFTVAITRTLPSVTHWLTWLGVIYILWLALKIARSQPANNTRSDVPLSFRTSFLLQFANVKIILYGVTALSTFVIPYTSSQVWIILISVLLALIGVFGNLCWAAAGHLFQAFLRQHGRLVNRILAGALVLVAVDMLL